MSKLPLATEDWSLVNTEQISPLHVCMYVFFPAGGIGRYTNSLMKYLNAVPGLSGEVVCSPDFLWKGTDDYAVWPGLKSLSHPIPTIRRFRFLQGQFVNPHRCIRHAVNRGASVIHFANINHLSFPFWRGALKASGLGVAATVHDVLRSRIVNKKWEDTQLRSFYEFADVLFVHSEYQARVLQQFADVPDAKIHVVPHGPYSHGQTDLNQEEARVLWNLPQDKQVALFFGQVREEKNLDGFLKAMQLSQNNIHLVVAGEAGGRNRKSMAYYKEIAKLAGVEDEVTFISKYITEEEVATLFIAADWATLPYDRSFTSQSGVLNVAMHYQRPVLVGSAPVLKETVTSSEVGVACENDTPQAIAKGIDRIYQALKEGFSYPMDEYRKQFSWDVNAKRTFDAYQQAVVRL